MEKSQRILAATDFGPLAQEAIRRAHERALATHGELAVCHVIPKAFQANVLFPHLTKAEVLRSPEELARVREALAASVQSATGRDEGQYTILLDDGIPYSTILTLAEDWNADLIVVGSHGTEDLSQLLLGRAAENVIRYAYCPVLVARPRRPGGIVAGTDFSEDAWPALEAAVDEARRTGSALTVVHSLELDWPAAAYASMALGSTPRPPSVEEVSELRRAVEDRITETVSRLGFTAEARVMDGPAGAALIQAAAEADADLIVVGTRGLTGLQRVLLGSVATEVVRSAPCSVMVVRRD